MLENLESGRPKRVMTKQTHISQLVQSPMLIIDGKHQTLQPPGKPDKIPFSHLTHISQNSHIASQMANINSTYSRNNFDLHNFQVS